MLRDILMKSINKSRRETLLDIAKAFEDRSYLKSIAGKNVFIDISLYNIAKDNPVNLELLKKYVNVDELLDDFRKTNDNLILREQRRMMLEEEK